MAVTKVINSESKQYKPVLTDMLVLDDVPTVNSLNGVTSDAVARAVAGASGEVPQVTENDNGKVLTAIYDEGGAAVEWAEAQSGYTAGTGITISEENAIAVTDAISNGAAAGATAVQPAALNDYALSSSLATVATSGSYADLSNKPSIPAAQVNSDWNASSGVAEILNKPNLATVATTGSYSDLSNKPSIPAAQVNSDWNASSGVSQILNKPTIPSVDQSYSASSTNAQSGVAVAEAVAGISVDEVPTVGSSDDGKVLTASYSGGVGSYSWETAQGGGASVEAGAGLAKSGDTLQVTLGQGLEFGTTTFNQDTNSLYATIHGWNLTSIHFIQPQMTGNRQSDIADSVGTPAKAYFYIATNDSLTGAVGKYTGFAFDVERITVSRVKTTFAYGVNVLFSSDTIEMNSGHTISELTSSNLVYVFIACEIGGSYYTFDNNIMLLKDNSNICSPIQIPYTSESDKGCILKSDLLSGEPVWADSACRNTYIYSTTYTKPTYSVTNNIITISASNNSELTDSTIGIVRYGLLIEYLVLLGLSINTNVHAVTSATVKTTYNFKADSGTDTLSYPYFDRGVIGASGLLEVNCIHNLCVLARRRPSTTWINYDLESITIEVLNDQNTTVSLPTTGTFNRFGMKVMKTTA